MSWVQWVRVLDRYVDTADLFRGGWADQPVEAAPEVTARLASDRNHLIQFLGYNPYIREVLQTMILTANLGRESPPNGGSSRSTAAASSRASNGSNGSNCSSSGAGNGSGSGGHSNSTAAQPSSSSNQWNTSTQAQASGNSLQHRAVTGSSDSQNSSSSNCEPQEQEDVPIHVIPRDIGVGMLTLTAWNIPKRYRLEELLEDWPVDGSYDFLHLRYSNSLEHRTRLVNINFTSAYSAQRFFDEWQGRALPRYRSKKRLSIIPAAVQGRDANLMLVTDSTPDLPVILLGERHVDQDSVRELIRLAKAGVFMCTI